MAPRARRPPDRRAAPGDGSRGAAAAFAAVFAALVIVRGSALRDPPYWDALLGLFPQAHWMAVHGLSPVALLREQPGFVEGGASVYPFSAVPMLLALLERALPEPATRFAIGHLASFACTALAAAALFRLVRPLGAALAWTVVAAFACQPLVQSMATQLTLEMPLTAACAWCVAFLARGRWRAATLAAAAALLVKPTGVIAPVAILAVLAARRLRPALVGAPGAGPPRAVEARWMAANAALVVVFLAELAVLAQFERAPPGAGPFAGLAALATKRLWTVPEFALALLALGVLLAIRIARGRWRPIGPEALAAGAFLALYLLLLAQWDNALPRYFLVAYPAVLALLAWGTRTLSARGTRAHALFAAIALFGLLGQSGRFHPDRPGAFAAPGESEPLARNDGWLLERSMRYRDGLALDRAIARAAEARAGTAFVAPWPLQQALLEPALGYVERRVECACAEMPVRWARPPAPDPRELARDGARDVLWILTSNDYTSPSSRPRAGDVVVERFQAGAQRAFFVRRDGWE